MNANRNQGFSMIEILVSILVLAFGLLGLAGLQSKLVVAEMESYQRAQALVLLEDMVERIRARGNMQDASAAIAAAYNNVQVGGNAAAIDCSGTAGTQRDLCEWGNALSGSSEVLNSKLTGGGGGAIGCISPGATAKAYKVSVAWQGYVQGAAPNDQCGSGSFGSENMRRVVSETVFIPNLGCLAASC